MMAIVTTETGGLFRFMVTSEERVDSVRKRISCSIIKNYTKTGGKGIIK